MPFYLAVIALLALLATGCNSTTGSQPQSLGTGTDELVLRLGNQVANLIVRIDRLEAEVSTLISEVAPSKVGPSVTTFNSSPFLGQNFQQEIARSGRLSESFWEDRLSRARLGLMGGSPTYEDVLAEKEQYDGWHEYVNWLRQNNNGFTHRSWQVGDEHLSRLDYLQLQLQWLLER